MAIDNYPPGMDPAVLDGEKNYEKLLDAVIDEAKVEYLMTASVNGEVIYEGKHTQDGIKLGQDAEMAVQKKFDELVELKREAQE